MAEPDQTRGINLDTDTPNFLLIGLGWKELKKVQELKSMINAGDDKPVMDTLNEALARGEKKFEDAGLGYRLINYEPDEGMERLEGILGERKWDGVCIGGGIRMNPKYTELFERLINTVHSKAPGAKFLFNTAPDNTIESVRRLFPEE